MPKAVSTLESPAVLRQQLAGLMLEPDEDVVKARRFVAQLVAIRDLIGPAVLAHSLEHGDDWVESVANLVTPDTRRICDDIQDLDERLHAEGVQTDVLNPSIDDPEERSSLGDAVVSLGAGYGTAGYMLGLAVGSLLGPHILDLVAERAKGKA